MIMKIPGWKNVIVRTLVSKLPKWAKCHKTMKWFVGLLLAIFVFYAFTIRAGHRWGDDYALYIHHA